MRELKEQLQQEEGPVAQTVQAYTSIIDGGRRREAVGIRCAVGATTQHLPLGASTWLHPTPACLPAWPAEVIYDIALEVHRAVHTEVVGGARRRPPALPPTWRMSTRAFSSPCQCL